MAENNLEDRAVGVILGACVGDILGANAEFIDYDKIAQHFPNGIVRDFGNSKDSPLGMYTDGSCYA